MDTNYKVRLLEIFGSGNISEEQINEIISLVLTDLNLPSFDENLETMINFLIESGDSALIQQEVGATGVTPQPSTSGTQLNQHYHDLQKLFPGICPNYLVEFCEGYDPFDRERIIEDLTNTDYVKVDKDPIDVWEHLKEMLPNADPIYLRNQARVLVHRPPEDLEEFVSDATENNDYPTMEQYLINKDLADLKSVYISNFSVKQYLQNVPNPVEMFSNPDRKPLLSGVVDGDDLKFAITFLYNQFLFVRKPEIKKIFFCYDKHLFKTVNRLKKLRKARRHTREVIELPECKNVELLKEISFFKHEMVIKQFLKQKDDKYRTALEEATKLGLLETCGCCFDDKLIPEECLFCKKGCVFCKDCIRGGAETVIGKEETVFPCLAHCDSVFDYATLQMVLDVKIMQGVWYRKQIEEIRNANLDGLETCPFCDFCMIPNEEDKIFKCENAKCMIESCRLCRHKSHIPLRCNEIEYDEDVRMRTYIENKMTEALLRRCWQCSKPFYKESGCNKMTCSCGAKMCYVCGAAVQDYTHFNSSRCPLYTDNLQQFHLNRVMQGAQSAKTELGINQNPNKLKFDPTRGVDRDVA